MSILICFLRTQDVVGQQREVGHIQYPETQATPLRWTFVAHALLIFVIIRSSKLCEPPASSPKLSSMRGDQEQNGVDLIRNKILHGSRSDWVSSSDEPTQKKVPEEDETAFATATRLTRKLLNSRRQCDSSIGPSSLRLFFMRAIRARGLQVSYRPFALPSTP